MRIMWLSNAPWAPSGYGQQTALFLPRIAALGHEVAIAANHGVQGTKLEWNGVDVYACDPDWGNYSIQDFANDYKADQVIALCDSWVMHPEVWPDLSMNIWAPVDHYPIPDPVLKVLTHERVRPIAMSRYGESLMLDRRALGDNIDPLYVPHGVDTSLFYPRPSEKAAVRKELAIPEDAFLVGMVAANQSNPYVCRKSFPQAFHAFSVFAQSHPDAHMFVHTKPKHHAGGTDLFALAQALGIKPDQLKFPPPKAWSLGMKDETVAMLYQAFDVLLMPSMGEGFGVPLIEAQASGVPVITSKHSAMLELGEAGWLVDGDPWWDPTSNAFLFVPFIESIVGALEQAYQARDDQKVKDAAVEFASRYEAYRVTEEFWKPALAALEAPNEVGPLEFKTAAQNGHVKANRAQRRALARANK